MPGKRRVLWFLLLIAIATSAPALAEGPDTQPVATTAADAEQAPQRSPDQVYGLWVITPAVLAIVLAIVLRHVIPALAIGVFAAAMMILPWSEIGAGGFTYNPIAGFRVAVETFLLGALQDVDHLMILLFTLLIGGVVEVISANGGTRAMVDVLGRWASTRRRGQVTAWSAGVAVFFGDYPNMLIVGPTMRPVFDRLRISRAKLAYIVDSTAAPIASLALVGEWVGVQVGYIQDGLDSAVAGDASTWVADLGAFEVFVASLPLRFYSLMALAMVLLIALLQRDFGPMLTAERRALSDDAATSVADETTGLSEANVPSTSPWLALVPLAVLIVATLALLIVTGWARAPEGSPFHLSVIMAHTDSTRTMLYASLLSLMVAIGMSMGWRTLNLGGCMDAMMAGFHRMFIAVVILSLAWALSDAMRTLRLAEVTTLHLQQAGVNPHALPVFVFLTAAGVSFATGTSWGTMGILMPVTVTVIAELAAGLPVGEARSVLCSGVAAVLAGAVFGDHCSPISDTTVLSAAATQCTIEQHVWTQIPYALCAAGIAMVVGGLLHAWADISTPVCLAIGVLMVFLLVRIVGRPVRNAAA